VNQTDRPKSFRLGRFQPLDKQISPHHDFLITDQRASGHVACGNPARKFEKNEIFGRAR